MSTLVNITIKDNKFLLGILILPVIFFLFYLLSYLPLQASLVLAAFLFVFILIAKIEFGLYLMAFFLPVIHWDFYIWKLQIPLIDLISVFVLTAFFVRYFMLTYLGPEEMRPKITLVFPKIFSFFFLAVIFSSFFSSTPLDSLWYGVRWILFFYLAYVILPVNIIRSEKTLKNILITIVLSATLVSIMSLASLYGQDWRNEFVRIKPIPIAGIFPFGENQNLIVEVCLPALFYVLALMQMINGPRITRFLNLVFLLLASVLVGTFSRGGWIALAVCLFVLVVYRYRQNIRHLLLPVFISLLILTPIFYYMYLMQTDYYIGVGSNQSRILSTQIAYNAFIDRPWLGNGSGEYMNIIANNVRFRAKFGDPLESHGVFQKIMAENGGLGLAGFTMFISSVFIFFYKSIKRLKKYDLLYLNLVLGASSIFIFEVFNTSYYKGKLWFPIALALLGANIYLNKEKQEYEKN